MQSQRALRFYLEELHRLGSELSLDGRIVHVSDGLAGAGRALARTARRSARTSPTGAPSSASMRGWRRRPGRSTSSNRRTRRSGRRPSMRRRPSLRRISRRSTSRWPRTDRPTWRAAACGRCAAPSTSSASIWRRSTCGRTPTCTRASSRSWWRRPGRGVDYAALDEAGACRPADRRTRQHAAAGVALSAYGDETAGELDAGPGGRRRASPLRPGGHAALRDLQGRQRLRHPGSGRAAQGGRPARSARGAARRRHRAAVRDHRRSAALRADHGRAARSAGLSPPARLARQRAGSDAGLFRQQQGRRLPHLDLGTVQGRARPDRDLPAPPGRSYACSTAAAARSGAAASRATTRSWRSRPAPCRAPSASPNRAR